MSIDMVLRRTGGSLGPRRISKICGLVGLAVGLVIGLYAVVRAYVEWPGVPGVSEVVVQLVIIAVLGASYGALGYAVGFVAERLRCKSPDK